MMRPEDAVPAAREAATAAKARGEYDLDLSGFAIAPTDRVSVEQLMEWAVIEPDESYMRSTRRFGAPITWLKKLLLRGLQQHFNQLTMLQARYNLHLLVRLTELEDQVRDLEWENASLRRRVGGETAVRTEDRAPGAPGAAGATDGPARA
ncbi:hypothetical protein NBH00_02105 [Paraconexibacter antarcticus]|uniref:Uncharacterized protein n=1 Tax=Paraconexibacter antarcticus TaxID=2949664 RepID=A0ABY5DVX8_9ACTN|nr:hypothetical protein [Paraconexibacter antarcticus]UTI65012.1 hypothetical protein NBH00_02105 [Paraconexibacter antarcticus]